MHGPCAERVPTAQALKQLVARRAGRILRYTGESSAFLPAFASLGSRQTQPNVRFAVSPTANGRGANGLLFGGQLGGLYTLPPARGEEGCPNGGWGASSGVILRNQLRESVVVTESLG